MAGGNNLCDECGAVGASKDDGLCQPCRKVEEGEYETRSEAMSALGKKGGAATKRAWDAERGVDPDELPPLETHEAAEVWLDVVGRAVVTGRLESKRAQACVRAVQTFLDARAERLQADRLRELREKLEKLEEELEEQRSPDWQ